MQVVSVDLGTAPMTASFFSPFLKIITVGMLRIPNSVAVEGLSSVFSLKNLSLPAYSFASSSMTGWIIRHGPHHGAQNSTRTGISDSTTSDFHVLSLTAPTAILKNHVKPTKDPDDGDGAKAMLSRQDAYCARLITQKQKPEKQICNLLDKEADVSYLFTLLILCQ